MKRTFTIIVIALLTLGLIVSWLFFLWEEDIEPQKRNIVDTNEEAITVGIAYLEILYPEYHWRDEKYTYFAICYPDPEGEHWTVTPCDTEGNTSGTLPAVSFRKNGEFVGTGFQAD